ncbi:MAG: pyridoxamine 5'-phosphate oxidase, partial [Steroidobacteraceae bacterium]|nr:pyridoxamine 5'-phosphate oxidase [Steroidobacteraceae bacterium]
MRPVAELLPENLPSDPLPLAQQWLAEAWAAKSQPNPNAMVLATADRSGRPSARVVLCKDILSEPGAAVFYTNYESRKGQEIAANAQVALVFHWDALHRQLRFEGVARKVPPEVSDEYFATRPWQRQIGAWASAQSRPLARRADLLAAVARTAAHFGTPVPGPQNDSAPVAALPRPPYWGGYEVLLSAVEFWVEGESRLHDRARYERELLP